MGFQCHASVALLPRNKPSNHCTRNWVGLEVSQDGCGISPTPGFEPKDMCSRSVTCGTNTYLVCPSWVLTLYHVLGDNCFGGSCCFHYQGRRWRQQIFPRSWKPPNITQGVIMQVTTIRTFTDLTLPTSQNPTLHVTSIIELTYKKQKQEKLRCNHVFVL